MDNIVDGGEVLGTTMSGNFSLTLASIAQLGGLVRLQPAPGNATDAVQPGDALCYDMATLLPERLPLAAPAPDACGALVAPTVISALSTLLTTDVPVAQATLKQAFSLPTNVTIGRYNAFQVKKGFHLHQHKTAASELRWRLFLPHAGFPRRQCRCSDHYASRGSRAQRGGKSTLHSCIGFIHASQIVFGI